MTSAPGCRDIPAILRILTAICLCRAAIHVSHHAVLCIRTWFLHGTARFLCETGEFLCVQPDILCFSVLAPNRTQDERREFVWCLDIFAQCLCIAPGFLCETGGFLCVFFKCGDGRPECLDSGFELCGGTLGGVLKNESPGFGRISPPEPGLSRGLCRWRWVPPCRGSRPAANRRLEGSPYGVATSVKPGL